MSAKSDLIIKFLQVWSWITFIGLSILTGVLIFNYFFIQYNLIGAKSLNIGFDLTGIYEQNPLLFNILVVTIILLTSLKATSFFFITQIFEKLKIVRPFSDEMYRMINKISIFFLSAGILGALSYHFGKGLEKRGFELSEANQFWNDYDAFLMMAAVVFIISQIFKRGLELQNESDLTV
ncbi:MAG TPA: DUF2975 domain-containing protein [Algoriphagus sp.]|nr:DUF2975 domain-containing protein [Algoriphagus sp.]